MGAIVDPLTLLIHAKIRADFGPKNEFDAANGRQAQYRKINIGRSGEHGGFAGVE